MFGLFSRRASDGLLAAALRHYPPAVPAHVGPASRLTPAQAEENLEGFLRSRPERLAALTTLAGDHGVDVGPALEPSADPAPTFAALTAWLASILPARRDMPDGERVNAPIDAFMASDRRGDAILFSLVADLALLEGEAIVRRRPEWRWTLNRDPADAGAYDYRRVVLARDRAGGGELVLDLEVEALQTVYALRAPGPAHAGQPLGRTLAGVLAGGMDAV